MYKIIIPNDSYGFYMDAKIMNTVFNNSKIYNTNDKMPSTEYNIFIDHVHNVNNLTTAKINILLANHEILLVEKHKDWQLKFMKDISYIFVKTHYGEKIMDLLQKKYKLKCKIIFIGFTTIFPLSQHINKRDYSIILHLAGAHRWKNTDAIIKCWLNNSDFPNIIIGCYDDCLDNGLYKYLTKDELANIKNHKNITFYNKKMEFDDIVKLKYQYAIHLCPSIREGYGHIINEGRITKSLIITSNLPPMNELIDSTCGILIECDDIIKQDNYSEICIINEKTIENTMRNIIMKLTKEEIIQYGEKAYNKYLSDSKIFFDNTKQWLSNHP